MHTEKTYLLKNQAVCDLHLEDLATDWLVLSSNRPNACTASASLILLNKGLAAGGHGILPRYILLDTCNLRCQDLRCRNTSRSAQQHVGATLGKCLQLGGFEFEALHERVVDLAGGRRHILLVCCQDLVLRRQQALCHPLQDRHPLLQRHNSVDLQRTKTQRPVSGACEHSLGGAGA